MIRFTCPTCRAALKAKAKMAGKTRKCPKCGTPVKIPLADASSEATPQIIYPTEAEARLPTDELLERLDRQNRYLICDETSLVAAWQNNGQGWMLKITSGFIPARRNSDQLPAYGNFTLVELQMEMTDQGLRLAAIASYQFAEQFALTRLDQGDDEILKAISQPGRLNRQQKNTVRQSLGNQFLREVWGDSTEVLEYLSNADYHSPSSRASE